MFEIVLYRPEIPQNTGNIIRLCANSGAQLHLVGPLGFDLDDKHLRRAGLDYRAATSLKLHAELETCLRQLKGRRYLVTTSGEVDHSSIHFQAGDVLIFGNETWGIPTAVRRQVEVEAEIGIPMAAGSRSINLANAVAIVLYEAWRQNDFQGRVPPVGK